MLCRLPPELWLSIFEHLQWPQHQLASMVSISPYTKDIVETILYREPMIGFSLEKTEISHLVEQFHRTVTKGDGHLADGVRRLSLGRFQREPTRPTAARYDTCLTANILLSLRNLKHLKVLYHGVTLVSPVVDPSYRFTSITHLFWSSEVNNAVSFAAFLGLLPSLEYMRAGGDDIGFIPLAPTALPLLRHLDHASLNFAESLLKGRHVPHLGLATNDFKAFLPILDGEINPTLLSTIKYVESLSMTSEELDPLTLMECAYLFREMRYLKISSDVGLLLDPIETLSLLAPSAARLCETKIEFLRLDIICDDDMEDVVSVKDLFSAVPSLKIFDFQRINDDTEDGFHRFRRDKPEDEPEWIEWESITEWDQWWTVAEADLENAKK